MGDVEKKTAVAAKWSTITELVAKCITPVTSMILARILAPEAFGVLATVTMVIAFAEVFVESGFQKYLIQRNFDSKEEEDNYMSVAFWANLIFSLVVWLLVSILNAPIAELVGNPGKGHLIIIAGVTIPLYGMIGIQTCKLKKDLNFKKLFYVRIGCAFVPLVVTIPLALLGLDYWSLIIGNIAGVVVQSCILFAVRSFVPRFFFSWTYLKKMLSYGVWTILNGVAVWLTTWIDTFLIGKMLSDYYLGLYKNSTSFITSIFSIVTASIIPVLFSSLSKLQDDEAGFRNMYLNIQRLLVCFLLPLGMGMFLYRQFATDIFFGSQWAEAAGIVGITAISTVFRTIYVGINGDVFRAKGQFKVPLFLQVLDLVITIPLCYLGLVKGFWAFVYIRAISRFILIAPELYYLKKVCKISPLDQVKTSWHFYLATAIMSVVAFVLQKFGESMLHNIVGIILCAIVYLLVLLCFKSERQLIRKFVMSVLHRK